jgi:hypothetical protein
MGLRFGQDAGHMGDRAVKNVWPVQRGHRSARLRTHRGWYGTHLVTRWRSWPQRAWSVGQARTSRWPCLACPTIAGPRSTRPRRCSRPSDRSRQRSAGRSRWPTARRAHDAGGEVYKRAQGKPSQGRKGKRPSRRTKVDPAAPKLDSIASLCDIAHGGGDTPSCSSVCSRSFYSA